MVRLLGVVKQGTGIADLAAYVARVSFNACNDYFRRRVPECRRTVTLDSAAPELRVAPVDRSGWDHHRTLQRIWREVLALPLAQRLALLLNLRAPEGGDALQFLPQAEIASKSEIGEALEMPADEFDAIWEMLPLDDAAIAARLKLTRQQVINLRKSARKRLERRMSVALVH
jgi:hypothetical protein